MKGKAKAVEFANEPYNIVVKGRNVLVTEAMKNYALDKSAKIERFSNRIIDVVITMDIQKLEHRVDIDMKVDHVRIRCHATTNDMYASVDLAVDKLRKQLRRYKARIQEHQTKSTSFTDVNVNVIRHYRDDLAEINEDIEDENQRRLFENFHPEVVSRETRPLKILRTDEAVMKLDLSGDVFLVYRGEEDKKLKVMYRRSDGHLGIIEAES